jgi:hypothetical protein
MSSRLWQMVLRVAFRIQPRPSRSKCSGSFKWPSTRLPHALMKVCLTTSVVCACHSGSGPSSIPVTGTWGGNHVTLTVRETGAHLEFDCAHGDIPGGLTTIRDGTFDWSGSFVREHGGPIRLDEVQDGHPASYAGSITGRSMRLNVRLLDDNTSAGSFTLALDVAGRVVKCL